VLQVVSASLGRGVRSGVHASLGVLAANTLYFALSAAGVGAALLASAELFLAIKWAGACYLVLVGLRMLLSRPLPGREARPLRAPRTFFRGFVVQGANPKAIVFFVALLPQFLDPSSALAPQVLILGASSVLIEFAALGCYALTASRAGRFAGDRLAGGLQRLGGAFLVAAGARLAAVRAE
jgi:threonine/homoserine/homoserine lactone efflux protein